MRLGLIGVVVLGILGGAFELFAEGHWRSAQQLIPWLALVLLGSAVVLLLVRDTPGAVNAVRAVALIVLLAAAFGVYAHVSANHRAGVFDPAWPTLSPLTQWWYALTKSTGSAPPLAPGMLAQSALLLVLATLAPAKVKAAEARL
ncbi:hypothetical protein HII36_31780 [Nonomuraea sp. NN258]|nr:hypothetical protein [Nonomuraea antri]